MLLCDTSELKGASCPPKNQRAIIADIVIQMAKRQQITINVLSLSIIIRPLNILDFTLKMR